MGDVGKLKYMVRGRQGITGPTLFSDGHAAYRFETGAGTGSMDVFEVFPGIELVYNDFSMKTYHCDLVVDGELLEINYCHEGREECRWICGDELYLGAGDLCIARMETGEPPLYFPTGHYRGITVILDLDALTRTALPVLNSRTPELAGLAGKFCPGHHFFAMRANAHIAHILAELYDIPKEIQSQYLQIKVLELLLFLHLVEPAAERRIDKITKGQIDVVKAVKERLCMDLTQDLTIEQLSKEFCISPTALKTNFKIVYNDSIKEYLRKVRMEQAAFLLRTGNTPVGEIASQVGYTNQSKFASAFKSVYALSPMEYRKKCGHEG